MSTPLLELTGVTRTFGRTTQALRGVDLRVEAGRGVGIVGESGAGKSTLLRLLLALDSPTSGTVTYRGEPLDRRDRAAVRRFRRDVQVVFQDPRSSLDPRQRVGSIVAEPLRSLRVEGDHRARVREVLASVGLDADVVDRYPAQFSGGQRQRIAIARALAPRPSVLVADEPVSALDVSVRRQVVDLLARLRDEHGLTLVLVSHDIAIVGQLCERTVVLHDGVVVEEGATREVLTTPREPYTRRLLAAVPRLPDATPAC
ncbi:ATP-binding cassette domain-containing protein [Cellulomonas sp. JZ18]|uniref:ABC transporter ATP-binding protein n=1 Tax=Cellulomonas sp. JZ18 TaxID=2654191 RepID=UPI0012D3E1CB|nr:ATP-binding cassette domain-containing protein [Cellulomonas sp. JZ18]QGQ18429.1 ATP-binding cassette domain-containing protein [Cellulomonas sp. JZ18]